MGDGQGGRGAGDVVRRCNALVVLVSLLAVTSCGAPAEQPSGSAAISPSSSAASSAASTVSTSGDDPLPDLDAGACGEVSATPADLADAQFALVGRVLSAADDIHPWTTDPENPDRPEPATTTRWVTFEVERWYLSDWGLTFSVWMPDIAASPGQRIAIGGNAYFTQVGDFAGQSGEVEFCAPLADGEASPADWDALLGEPLSPSSTVAPTTIALDPAKVFGERSGPCGPTVLTNGNDNQTVLAAGVTCFLDEVRAGRPLVWDVLIPTVEGDPIVTRYEFDGTTVVITTDNSFDNFGSGGVFEQRCSNVVPTNWLLEGVDCTTSTGVGFIEASLDTRP